MIAILRLPVKTHWEWRESRISLPKLPLGSAGSGGPLSDGRGSASCPVVPGLSPLVTSLLSGRGFVAYLCLHEKFQVNLRILAIAV